VAEAEDAIHMLEPKAKNQMEDLDVLAKQDAAKKWCGYATAHAATCGGKPWKYSLIAHDRIAANMTITGLVGIAALK
jgi:type III restriction enzyme